jgi:hypothetical protein
MRPNLPAYPSRFTAYKWVDGQLRSLERTGIDSSKTSDRPEGGWKTDATSRPIEIPSVEWCMDTRNIGRRVLLRGLPGMTPEFRIRQAGADYGVRRLKRRKMSSVCLGELRAVDVVDIQLGW